MAPVHKIQRMLFSTSRESLQGVFFTCMFNWKNLVVLSNLCDGFTRLR